jgi:uncharacterized phage-associated protein
MDYIFEYSIDSNVHNIAWRCDMKNYIFVAVNRTKWNRKRKYFHSTPKKFLKTLPKYVFKCYTTCTSDLKQCAKEVKLMADIFDFANFFIDLSLHNEEDPMTNLRLNKLLYFAQGCSLAKRNKPLFDDDIQAWTYGPVIPAVYHCFKSYKKEPIDRVYRSYDPSVFSDEEFDLLLDVAREFGKFTSPTLVNISHSHSGPWHKVFDNNPGGEIKKEDIKKYFQTDLSAQLQTPMLDNADIIHGKRDKNGYLVLPKELDDDWIV